MFLVEDERICNKGFKRDMLRDIFSFRDDKGNVYCFNENEAEDLIRSEINPYTSEKLPRSFLERLFVHTNSIRFKIHEQNLTDLLEYLSNDYDDSYVDEFNQKYTESPYNPSVEEAARLPCLKKYELKSLLGRGAFGSVFRACKNDICDIAVKVLIITTVNMFQNEVNSMKLLNTYDLGPKFLGACVDSYLNVGVIFMEAWDATLEDHCTLTDSLVLKLLDQIKTYHQLGWLHLDITDRNILLKLDSSGNPIDITLADFGTSKRNETFTRHSLNNYIWYQEELYPRVYNKGMIDRDDVLENPALLDYYIMYDILICNDVISQSTKDLILETIEEEMK